MCQRQATPDVLPLGLTATEQPLAVPVPSSGSRRRRLWELDGHAYCPVVGVCLPLP